MADNRKKNSDEADKASGSYNSASTSWGDDDYMRGLTKAQTQRDQEKMRKDADTQNAKSSKKPTAKPSSFSKGGMVRKTGMAKVHKGEKVLTAKAVKASRKKTSSKRG